MSDKPGGILKKNTDAQKAKPKRAKIIWDEANLEHNEANKSATMKITEPDTPYNHEFDYRKDLLGEEDDDDIEDEENSNESDKDVEDHVEQAKIEEIAPAVDPDELASKLAEVKEDREEAGEHWHPNEAERKDNEFKHKRKHHYNEFLMAKKLAEKLAKEEEDDDDDDDSD